MVSAKKTVGSDTPKSEKKLRFGLAKLVAPPVDKPERAQKEKEADPPAKETKAKAPAKPKAPVKEKVTKPKENAPKVYTATKKK